MRTHRKRLRRSRRALSFAGLALLSAAPSASANVYTDVNDFNLIEWVGFYSSYTSTSSSGVQYRWVDSPWKPTYISTYSCVSNGQYAETYYPPSYTAYQYVAYLPAGWCFRLAGRTAPGYGSMFYYDGRLSR